MTREAVSHSTGINRLKSSGAALISFLANHYNNITFRSAITISSGVWLCPSLILDGDDYYEYTLVHINAIMIISKKR